MPPHFLAYLCRAPPAGQNSASLYKRLFIYLYLEILKVAPGYNTKGSNFYVLLIQYIILALWPRIDVLD
jgi:hypothetical protein